jgi:hypothetical protein
MNTYFEPDNVIGPYRLKNEDHAGLVNKDKLNI